MKKITPCFCSFILLSLVFSCKKSVVQPSTSTPDTIPVVVKPPSDPDVANTIGFFLNDWTAKSFTVPSYTDTTLVASSTTAFVTIDGSNIITKVPSTIFGQNANSWMTQIVSETPLMNHLKNLHPGVIRFPGGSISDVYFWNGDQGVHPADAPDTILDADGNNIASNFWYGKNNSSWTISLDSYYSLLQQTGSQGIITVNYGYARYGTATDPVAAAAHLAADWVRYDNGRTKYWEIGNEDNGTWEAGYRINTANNHDGQPQIITGGLYGQHCKVFIDSMRKAAQELGKTIYIGAQLLEKQPESWQTNTDKGWNTGILSAVNNTPDFYIVHSYFTPYKENSSTDIILNTAISNTSGMMNYVKTSFTNAGAIVKPVALTEWNIVSEGSMQQVSYVSGMHAAILLGELIKNKYGESSRWDLANGWGGGNDMGLFNIGDEPGVSKWNPRPSFYYMYYFQKTMGDRMLSSTVTGSSDVLSYGSSFSSGEKSVVLVNKGASSVGTNIVLKNAAAGSRCYFYVLTGGTDNGAFSRKVLVNGKTSAELSGGPADYATLKPYSSVISNGINITLPAHSVVYMVIGK